MKSGGEGGWRIKEEKRNRRKEAYEREERDDDEKSTEEEERSNVDLCHGHLLQLMASLVTCLMTKG